MPQNWPDAASQPSASLARCKICTNVMCLLLQLNGDLPERFEDHERRLYIFACRNKACGKKGGTVRALRGTRNRTSSSGKKSAGKESKPLTQDSSSSSGPQANLGNSVFAATSFTPSPSQNPFAFTSKPIQNPFAPDLTSNNSSPPSQNTQFQPNPSDLPTTFADKARITEEPPPPQSKEPWPPEPSRPKPHPSYHLDADYEAQDPTPPTSSKSKMDITAENGSTSKDEDKETFESALDKTFQRFADRLAQNPEQVLRYEFGGAPLLYSKSDAVGKNFSPAHTHIEANSKITTQARPQPFGIPACPNCGKGRVFEMQLVPHAIAELEVEETGLDGMEWGTIIVGVCSGDCEVRGVRRGEWGWLEEWVGVQWEEDGRPGKA